MTQPKTNPLSRHKGIYLLPNAFTTGNLFAGFFAIIQAMNGYFLSASIAILIAMLLDSMDGRVARLTNTQSVFGEQYDSMSDMVSFGAAPAMVMYEFVLQDLGRFGLVAAFIYIAGAALRLARFNANIAVVDSRYFQGLPSPAGAGIVSSFVLFCVTYDIQISHWLVAGVAAVVTVFAGITMVTNIPYFSGKKIGSKTRMSVVPVMLGLIVVFSFVLISPPLMLLLIFMLYAISGYVIFFVKHKKGIAVSDAYGEMDLHEMRGQQDLFMQNNTFDEEVVDPIAKIKEVVQSVNDIKSVNDVNSEK